MTVFTVPALEDQPWPTLGPLVCGWIEANLVFGPGDLRGDPAKLDAEKRALVYRSYELFPDDHPNAGRRRFRRVALSLQKGSAKTELAAWLAAAELHPDAPVRCYGFDGRGSPKGKGVTDPYVPLIAYTEEQSDELAYGALRVILGLSRVAGDFDIGLERIIRKTGDGKAVSLATAPDARDGARTTFQVFDETHRFTLPRLKAAVRTMLANLPKRRIADPWSLEITTAYAPGENSVAEDTMTYARAVSDGQRDDSRLFYFHRQAADEHDFNTPEGVRAGVLEAAGAMAEWKDIDGICEQWEDPTADVAYLERVYGNRPVQSSQKAFDVKRWRELAKPEGEVGDGELITLGFDGSRTHDATALVGTHVPTGYQWLVGLWEAPLTQALAKDWEVPEADVDATVAEAFRRWNVWRMYADPYWWEGWIAQWQGQYGDKCVVKWPTNRITPMSYAVKAYDTAMKAGELSHDGNLDFARHIGNACRQETNYTDERGQRMYLIRKERPDSVFKMDAAMAGCLSWEARNDAIASGVLEEQSAGVLFV